MIQRSFAGLKIFPRHFRRHVYLRDPSIEVMRDILQSRYLRSNVAHKQLARTSLSNQDDGSSNVTNLHTGKWKALVLHAVFIFVHFADILVLSTTWNDLFCSCVVYGSRWRLSFNFVLSLKNCFQFNSRIVRTQFASVMTLNNWEMIAWNCNFAFLVETRSFSSRWRSRCRRRRFCSLIHVVDTTRKCTCKACETTVFYC